MTVYRDTQLDIEIKCHFFKYYNLTDMYNENNFDVLCYASQVLSSAGVT